MNKLVFTPLLLVAGACMMQQQPAEMSGQAQSQLAAETASRVAGPPQNCVSQRDLTGNRSIGEGAIVFRTQSSDLIYVNRPPAGCPETGIGGTLVTRTTGAQLCSGDIVTVVDPVNGTSYGSCPLGAFTPFRRMR
jgi:hypothetical protein